MVYAKFNDAQGDYVNEQGERFVVVAARRVRNVQGVNEGYTEFGSLEDALNAWGLRQVQD